MIDELLDLKMAIEDVRGADVHIFALELVFVGGLTFDECAKELGVSATRVKQLVDVAINLLRDRVCKGHSGRRSRGVRLEHGNQARRVALGG